MDSAHSVSTVDFSASTNHGLQVGSARDVYYNIQEPSLAKPKPTTTVPFGRDSDFVQRDELNVILDMCKPPFARVGLVGLGGMGKSQLAIEFSWRIREASPDTSVFWVHASNSSRILESYKRIADRMKIPGKDDIANHLLLRRVGAWLGLEENGKWVVIVDNADDIDVLEELSSESLPEVEHGKVLVTSRTKDAAHSLVGNFHDIIELGPMCSEDAGSLFRKKCYHKQTDEEIADLVRQLDYVPLAIVQAASFIQKVYPRMTIVKYLDAFKRTDSDAVQQLLKVFRDRRRDQEAKDSILLTWIISFEHIRTKAPPAADLLSFMSLCDRQGIPEMLLLEGMKTAGNSDSLDSGLEILRDYSLVTVDLDGGVFEMHRLVQLATRSWLEQNSYLDHWKAMYIQTMDTVFPSGEYETWQTCSLLHAHARLLLQYPTVQENLVHPRADALERFGTYCLKHGQWPLAETCFREVITEKEKVFGTDDQNTIASMINLVSVLAVQDKREELEQLQRTILASVEEKRGTDHHVTMRAALWLASLLMAQDRYCEAEPCLRSALSSLEKLFGRDDGETLNCMLNLVTVLRHQGKYEEAEQTYQEALILFERRSDKDSLNTMNFVSNLISKLRVQGEHQQAEDFAQRSVQSTEGVLGKDHPSTLSFIRLLSQILDDQGRYEEAADQAQQALRGYEKVLGKYHPDTLKNVATLVEIRTHQDRIEEIEGLSEWFLIGLGKWRGRTHWQTLQSAEFLAEVLRHQGKCEKADELEREYAIERTDTETSETDEGSQSDQCSPSEEHTSS